MRQDPVAPRDTPSRFYVTGCQRSGTTMMRLVLESHPLLACFDEERSYELLPRLEKWRGRRALRRPGKPMVGFKIPRFAEQLLADNLDDPDYGHFPNPYRGDPVIFMHRDVRDVVTSMLALRYPDGETWMSRYGRPILAGRAGDDEAFSKRYAESLGEVQTLEWAPHAVGALYWRYKTDAFFDYVEAGLPVLGVRYEKLAEKPEPEMRRVLEFLHVHWDRRVLDHPKGSHSELDRRGIAIGGTDPNRSIDRRSVGRYRRRLKRREIEEVLRVAGDTPGRLAEVLHA